MAKKAAAPKDTTATTEKKEKAERISRDQAAAQAVMALEETTTLNELAKMADELFVQGGGDTNVRNQKVACARSLIALEAAGIVKLTKPTDVIIEKVEQ